MICVKCSLVMRLPLECQWSRYLGPCLVFTPCLPLTFPLCGLGGGIRFALDPMVDSGQSLRWNRSDRREECQRLPKGRGEPPHLYVTLLGASLMAGLVGLETVGKE